jgi:hypothetical protein
MNFSWDFQQLCSNKNFNMEIILSNQDLFNDWNSISYNNNLTINIILQNLHKDLNWFSISSNSNITMDIVEQYKELPWDRQGLSFNDNIIKHNMKKSSETIKLYDIYKIYKHKNFNVSKFLSNIKKDNRLKYYMKGLSSNSNVNSKDIENNIDLDWDWNLVSKNINLSSEFIQKYIYKLNWENLSLNPTIDIDFIESTLNDLPWDFRKLSKNPNLNLKFIEKYIDHFDFDYLSENIFLYNDFIYKKNIEQDIEKRKTLVKNEIKDIFYKDICGEILKYVGYN